MMSTTKKASKALQLREWKVKMKVCLSSLKYQKLQLIMVLTVLLQSETKAQLKSQLFKINLQ